MQAFLVFARSNGTPQNLPKLFRTGFFEPGKGICPNNLETGLPCWKGMPKALVQKKKFPNLENKLLKIEVERVHGPPKPLFRNPLF